MQDQGLALGTTMASRRDSNGSDGNGETMSSGHHHQRFINQDHHHQQMLKAEIAAHPLSEQLLSAHVSCLRIATPVDQLPLLDSQLSHSTHLLRSYADQGSPAHHQTQELDTFLTQYMLLLCSFKEQLQQHVRVDAVEAVLACREIEHSLHSLTGATIGEGTGGTMSDDEDEDHDQLDNYSSMEQAMMGSSSTGESQYHNQDLLGFGPLLLSESERTLMERVRHELKLELKQGFKSRIEDVREEILRKRRAGKLPGDTTSVLKEWWDQHAKWPYPTEDDKAKLVEETGLQLKQINNWFINQRKRNWHRTNSQSSASLKSKRRR